MASRPKPASDGSRYWRTFRRKLGEGFDLAGKALIATAGAATFTPLATQGALRFPTLTVGAIFAAGLATFVFGIHLQAQAKPDE